MAPAGPYSFGIFSLEIWDDSDPSARSRLRRGDSDPANGSGGLRRPTSGGALACHLNRCRINTTVISIAAAAAASKAATTAEKEEEEKRETRACLPACLAACPAVVAALALPFSIEPIHIRSCEFKSVKEEWHQRQWPAAGQRRSGRTKLFSPCLP